jgi:hypothetical protein
MGTPGTAGVFLEVNSGFPTELAGYSPFATSPSYRIGAAILWYSNDYSASATFGQVIYFWAALCQDPISHINFLMFGNTYIPDAMVSTTPQVNLIFALEVSGLPATGFGTPTGYAAPQSHNQYNMYGKSTSQDGQDVSVNGQYYLYNNDGFIVLWLGSNIYLDATRTLDGGAVISYNVPGLFEGVEPIANFPEVAIAASGNAGITPGGAAATGNPDHVVASGKAMRSMSAGRVSGQD